MPQSHSVFGQVETFLNNKKYSAAMGLLSTVSVQYSKNTIFLSYLAKTQRALNDVVGLKRTLKEIIKTDASVGRKLEFMQTLYAEGSINEALDIGLGLQEKTLSSKEQTSLAHLLIRIFVEENDFDGVQETINRLGSALSHDDFIQWAMGLVSISRGDKNSALIHFRKALEINNKNDQAWVSLALLHDDMGDRELAIANLEMALDQNPLNQSAVKLYSTLLPKNSEKIEHALRRIRFYLAENDFDEEISLCHIQIASQVQSWKAVNFEINKLILNQPLNVAYADMKKNLGSQINV